MRGYVRDYARKVYHKWWAHRFAGGPSSPLTGGEGPTVEVALYRTRELDQRNGSVPTEAVAEYAAEALDRAGFQYRVHHDFDPIDAPTNGPHDGALDWWNEQDPPVVAAHSNLLLLDARGGGLAGLTGKFGVAPGQHITYRPPVLTYGFGDEFRNIRACLHEIGHNLGGKHADNMLTPPKMWWNETAIDDYHETVKGQSGGGGG